MDLSTPEIDVLRRLAHTESGEGMGLTVHELRESLHRNPAAVISPSDVMPTLRLLRKKRLVAFATGEGIAITETGLAALSAM